MHSITTLYKILRRTSDVNQHSGQVEDTLYRLDLNTLRQKSEGFREMFKDWKGVEGEEGYNDATPVVIDIGKSAFEVVLQVILHGASSLASGSFPAEVYFGAFRLIDMYIMPDVALVLKEHLDKDRAVSNAVKLRLAIMYKFHEHPLEESVQKALEVLEQNLLERYAKRALEAIDNGNLSGSDYDTLGSRILGILTPAVMDIMYSRMTMARHVPPYCQSDKCRKGDLCAFGWKDVWRRVYSKGILRRGNGRVVGYDLYILMSGHEGKVPDICSKCHNCTVERLYDTKYFEQEDDIITCVVQKLFKLEISKI